MAIFGIHARLLCREYLSSRALSAEGENIKPSWNSYCEMLVTVCPQKHLCLRNGTLASKFAWQFCSTCKRKPVAMFALSFVYFQSVHTNKVKRQTHADTALNLSVFKGQSLTWVMTFLALLYLSWSCFPTSTISRKKHLLQIAPLNDTNRLVVDLLNAYCLRQAEGGKDT